MKTRIKIFEKLTDSYLKKISVKKSTWYGSRNRPMPLVGWKKKVGWILDLKYKEEVEYEINNIISSDVIFAWCLKLWFSFGSFHFNVYTFHASYHSRAHFG